jgi:hypothetical protein
MPRILASLWEPFLNVRARQAMVVPDDFVIAEPPVAGMQRLRARFSGHAYDRHRHETYAVGLTEAGLQCFHYRGAARASTAGRVIVIHPDEAHDGHAGAPDGFAYRMLYADPSLIASALAGWALCFHPTPPICEPKMDGRLWGIFAHTPRGQPPVAERRPRSFARPRSSGKVRPRLCENSEIV